MIDENKTVAVFRSRIAEKEGRRQCSLGKIEGTFEDAMNAGQLTLVNKSIVQVISKLIIQSKKRESLEKQSSAPCTG